MTDHPDNADSPRPFENPRPPAETPAVIPVRLPSAPPPPPRGSGGRTALLLFLFFSLGLNFFLCGGCILRSGSESDLLSLTEKTLYGPSSAADKVAVVRVNGVLMEGMIDYDLKQIEKAIKDDDVKAVVLRIDSPGGTITASENLHKHLIRLRDGGDPRFPKAKPKHLVVSMGSLAASGGYYIAMPAEKLFAEKTTLTGSVGVYAALPNVSELTDRIGFHMELVKAGRIKASGSPFHTLTPEERQPWQDMVDNAYDQFLDIVTTGRQKVLPKKEQWRDEILFTRQIEVRNEKGNVVKDWWGRPITVPYSRYRADGGTYTAQEAKKYGLIDEIGDLEAAVDDVAKTAGLSKFKVVVYDKPPSLLHSVLGIQAPAAPGLDWAKLSSAATPRLWYMVPQADLAGLLTASAGGR